LRFLGLLLLLNGSTLNQESLNHGVQWWRIDDSTDESNCSVASRSTLIQGSSGGYKRVRVWLRFARRHKSLSNITFPAMDSIASYAPIPSEVVMSQILQTGKIFKLTTGSPEFLYTSVLFAQDGATFEANFFGRGKVDPRKLLDVQHIPPHSSCPTVRPGCSIATSLEKWYIKTPNLMYYDGGNYLAELVLRELTTCEIISRSPHRNLAKFKGYEVANDRIVGLCFELYAGSLQDRLNPGSLNKSCFILSQDHVQSRRQASRYLPQIEDGVRYLHSLDLVHNDINPANIMLDEKETPTIIDFDSSCAPGQDLGMAKRTCRWYDPQVSKPQVSNDLDALAELRV
jgi:hypothetical protein